MKIIFSLSRYLFSANSMLGAEMQCEKREKKKRDSSFLKTTVKACRNPSSHEVEVKMQQEEGMLGF